MGTHSLGKLNFYIEDDEYLTTLIISNVIEPKNKSGYTIVSKLVIHDSQDIDIVDTTYDVIIIHTIRRGLIPTNTYTNTSFEVKDSTGKLISTNMISKPTLDAITKLIKDKLAIKEKLGIKEQLEIDKTTKLA